MEFEISQFAANPKEGLKAAGKFRKETWRIIAEHYHVEVRAGCTKRELREAVLRYFAEAQGVDVNVQEGESGDSEGYDESGDFELRKLQMELEFRREQAVLEREERERQAVLEREREEREAVRRREEREHELELARIGASGGNGSRDEKGLLYKARSLVPKFVESEPDDFFNAFEEVAQALEWEKQKWPLLAQTAFSGKALAAYLALGSDARGDYESVKREILKVYQITPEYHRSKFREVKKTPGQRFAEYAQSLERSLSKWWRALEIDTLEAAKEAVLLEQFLRGVSPEVRLYLMERRVNSVAEATSLAEDFVLVARPERVNASQPWHQTPQVKVRGVEAESSRGQARCFICGRQGHQARECPRRPNLRSETAGVRPKCYVCGQIGHYASLCKQRRGPQPENWRAKERGVNACVLRVPSEGLLSDSGKLPEEKGMWRPYSCEGYLATSANGENRTPVKILRDTGASHTLVKASIVPKGAERAAGSRLMQGFGGLVETPIVRLMLQVDGKSRWVSAGLAEKLPIEGVDVLLGNDVGGGVMITPLLVEEPLTEDPAEGERAMFPGCCTEWKSVTGKETGESGEAAAVTRAMARRRAEVEDNGDLLTEGVGDLFTLPQMDDQQSEMQAPATAPVRDAEESTAEEDESDGCPVPEAADCSGEARAEAEVHAILPVPRSELIKAQREDQSLQTLLQEALTEEEAADEPSCYYLEGGLLKRKWRNPSAPCEEHETYRQVVLPLKFREEVTRMAHEEVASHLGARKTGECILSYFFWPGITKDVTKFCRECEVCQVCKTEAPARVPLQPIPVVGDPFDKIVMDIVGPLPRTKLGNEYLLTLMCTVTRYADAVPVSSCKSRKLLPKLMDTFSKFGVPKTVQTDRGSNFMGNLFQQALRKMGINHVASSAYHPQSQGCLERFHRTLKSILTKFCLNNQKDWDEGIQVALYAIRTAKHEGLGYSPFELMFGRRPRENLRILYESWEEEMQPQPLTEYVTKLRDRLRCAHDLARENLEKAQQKMKEYYDRKSRYREFKEGDLVLLFDSTRGKPLQARYRGPFVVLNKLGPVNYLISTPGRRKQTRNVHINLLRKYEGEVAAVACVGADTEEEPDQTLSKGVKEDFSHERLDHRLDNSRALDGMSERLSHLGSDQRRELLQLLRKFPQITQDTPTRTHVIEHDVALVEGARPVKQYPYRLSPEKRELMRQEVQYLLDNDLAVPSCSPWAAPCLLVPKGDGAVRLCTDFRRLNQLTVADSFPMPRIDDLVDEVSSARFLTKVDLLKGFYQVPLSSRAREASAFVTPDGLYEYKVMPFGMKNSGSTFQRLASWVVRDLVGVRAYIDDIVIFSDSWEEHLMRMQDLFSRLSEANLTINLPKCDFACSTVLYLGHRVGRGGIRPMEAKVTDILQFRPPSTRRGLRKFLGLIGFYRRFCKNFAQVATPLTDLLSERRNFQWSDACEKAFKSLKALLVSTPILRAPRFDKPFVISVDASDVGVGGVLGQEENGVLMPVAYMSKKLLKHQRKYSAIEKEALAVIKSLEKFEVYTGGEVVVYSDHNPLKFVDTMKSKNARLARWALVLQDKNIKIKHVPGKLNVVADALSRPN